jgi:hypothetical protein
MCFIVHVHRQYGVVNASHVDIALLSIYRATLATKVNKTKGTRLALLLYVRMVYLSVLHKMRNRTCTLVARVPIISQTFLRVGLRLTGGANP